MTFAALFDFAVLVFLKTARAERDGVIQLYARTDFAGLTDDDAGAVIDKEMRADPGAGMNIDAGAAVGPLGHDPRDERQILEVKNVGHALDGDRFERRISQNNFFVTFRRRVAFVSGVDVGPDH